MLCAAAHKSLFPSLKIHFSRVLAGYENTQELSLDDEFSRMKDRFSEMKKDDSELTLFLNRIAEDSQNVSFNENDQTIFNKMLDRLERMAVVLWGDKFDEIDAAMYLRIPDPYHKGAETIRYHALRSRKLTFHKIGKTGLTFTKADLDRALKHFKLESHRDL